MPLSTRKNEQIRRAVETLLREADVKRPPLTVEKTARLRAAEIRYVSFEGDMSGLLAREGDGYPIGVNALHAKTRQRFTIAHELGHLELGDLEQCGKQETYRVTIGVRLREFARSRGVQCRASTVEKQRSHR